MARTYPAGLEWLALEDADAFDRAHANDSPELLRIRQDQSRKRRMAREAKAFRPSDAELVAQLLRMEPLDIPSA